MSNGTQMDPMIAIKKIIDKAGIDGALTEDAVKYFNKTLETNKTLKTNLDELRKTHAELDKKHSKTLDELSETNKLLLACKTREDAINERENNMLKLELEAQYERERVTDHKEMFGLVFRNIETRRNVFTPVPGASGVDQYGSQLPIGHAEEDIEKTERS